MKKLVLVGFLCLVFIATGAFADEQLTPEQILKNRIAQANANITSIDSLTLRTWIDDGEKDFLLLDVDVADVLGRFEGLMDGWDRIVEDASGLDLARVKVRSPVVPLLRFRLGVIIALMAVHERRHLWQAERVLQAEGFPTA